MYVKGTPAGWAIKTTQGRWKPSRHLILIQKALMALETGEIENLILTLPPRHGKSEFVTRAFPGWWLGNHPHDEVVITSYEATLATDFGGNVRDSMEEYGQEVFGLGIRSNRRASKNWRLEGLDSEGKKATGGLRATGLGGGLAGRGGDLIIIDDPIKNALQAQSETFRKGLWEGYLSTVYTRKSPTARQIVVTCMTGGTPVLMADGAERELREIRAGDEVATHEDGHITTSVVNNWRSSGVDAILKVQTRSGRIVRANARHPFLVDRDGSQEWVRLRGLSLGDQLVSLRGAPAQQERRQSRESVVPVVRGRAIIARTLTLLTEGLGITGGAGRLASPMDVIGRSRASGCAAVATGRPIRPKRPLPSKTGRGVSSIGMVSPWKSTTTWLSHRMDSVLSAVFSRLIRTLALTGMGNCASTIAMTPAKRGGSCATTATSLSGMAKARPTYAEPLSTFGVTTDEIVSIVPDGEEEVFDVEIDRTGNFIANGVVSHNTRWHDDDLVGRLLDNEDTEGQQWTVLNLAAICDEEDDPLERELGEALWPERWSLKRMLEIKATYKNNPYWWAALYQGRPAPASGNIFKRGWWRFWQPKGADLGPVRLRVGDDKEVVRKPIELPTLELVASSWDLAVKKGPSTSYVAGQKWGKAGANAFLLDQTRQRRDFPETVRAFRQFHTLHDDIDPKWVEDKANGPALIALLTDEIPGIVPIEPKGTKEDRARAVAYYCEARNVYLPHPVLAPWIWEFIEEHAAFPNAMWNDQVDTTSQALKKLFADDHQPSMLWGRRHRRTA